LRIIQRNEWEIYLSMTRRGFPMLKPFCIPLVAVFFSTDLAGRTPKKLFNVPGNAYWFRWSPDGKRLRFTVIDTSTETTSIWEIARSEQKPHLAFPVMHHHHCCGTWTPDGKFFIFQIRAGDTYQIWADREYGFRGRSADSPFPLLAGAISYRGPVPSNDGKRLFVRSEAPRGELVRYDQRAQEFVSFLPSVSARTVAFSRDGHWIAYSSVSDNNLWRCRADGTDCQQLTRGFKNTVLPAWSPDNRSISFMGSKFSGAWVIYTVPRDGGSAQPITSGGQAEGYPSWSPDGSHLAFGEVPPLSQSRGIHILHVRSNTVSDLPNSSTYYSPDWSPNGDRIAAIHSGDQFIYVFDLASRTWKCLAKLAANYLSWSHDSRYIYFLSSSADSRSVYRVSVADASITKITDLSDVERGRFFMSDGSAWGRVILF
jgi:Tol biopolymer transport system component